MFKLLVVLLVCLAEGCATTEAPVRVRTPVSRRYRIEWEDDPHVACEKAEGRQTVLGTIRGCSFMRDGDCVIIAARPTSEKDFQRFITLGHELLHCELGQWHDKWGEMQPAFKPVKEAK